MSRVWDNELEDRSEGVALAIEFVERDCDFALRVASHAIDTAERRLEGTKENLEVLYGGPTHLASDVCLNRYWMEGILANLSQLHGMCLACLSLARSQVKHCN